MNRFHAISLLAIPALLLFSCSNEVKINADWKETIVVYGLLDPTDTVQYFRIEKAYLDDKNSALITAKISDSLILDPASIELFQVDDTSVKIPLTKIWYIPKEPGIFANDQNLLYKTNYPISPDKEYELRITSQKTGQRVWARTRTMSPSIIVGPVKSNNVTFSIGTENISFEWIPRSNSFAYDVKMQMVYDEFSKNDTNTKQRKTINWDVLTNFEVTPNNSAVSRVPRQAFLQFLSASLTADSLLYRRIKYVNFLYYGGNQTLADYISVNRPSIGIVQKTAEYTNINGGYGIFASRCFQPVREVKISTSSLKVLQTNPETIGLHFVQ